MFSGRTPLIHFCANSHQSNEVVHVLYELGCRIARPFVIHRRMNTVPRDGVVVLVGKPPENWRAEAAVVRLKYEEVDARQLTNELRALDASEHLFGCAACLLAFKHEDHSQSDCFGRTLPVANALVAQDIVHYPWLELIAEEIWSRLRAAGCPDVGAKRPWDQTQVKLCMTHDVDGPELFSLFATVRSAVLGMGRGDRYERESFLMSLLFRLEGRPDPYFNFSLWRDYESLYGGRGTFFVYPGKLANAKWHRKDPKYDPRKKALRMALTEAAHAGWEVGAHLGIMAREAMAYTEARRRLSEIAQADIVGARGHYWQMDWEDPYCTWRELASAGFTYDMTLSPMTLGFRGGFMLPISPGIRWGNLDPVSFIVVPTPIMDAYAVPRVSGRSASDSDGVLDELVKNAQRVGGALVVDWHERTFINRGAWTGYLEPLSYLVNRALGRGGVGMISGQQLASDWRRYVRDMFGGIA